MAQQTPQTSAAPRQPELPQSSPSGIVTATTVVVVIASLYFGRDFFIPMALSVLLSFALAPPVRWLRRAHIPRLPAVLLVVALAFVAIGAFSAVVGLQVAELAQRLPSYQRNIEAKIESFRAGPPGGRLYERLSEMMRDIGRKIDAAEPPADIAPDRGANSVPPVASAPAADSARQTQDKAAAPVPRRLDEAAERLNGDATTDEPAPIPVEVRPPDPTSLELLQKFVSPVVGPLATAGIVIVFVIFMLLKREDLRDRLIRLAGARDLSRTTDAIDDAARRVGHYLLMQLVVNLTYGIPVGIGLWLIGVPNPILWGMLATVLRFVPYIGPVIAAFFPLALAIAVDPGWETLLWTGALLIVIELISNNAIEPWLYGSSTGLSPVAIIAAAIFWTWLWGPIGLLLSTPLTVCLVVLGQHVPQLAFLDVLFGSEPVLTPEQTLYQRLLVGDPDEATERAEDYLREHPLETYYDAIALPALGLAEFDRKRGVLEPDRRERLAQSVLVLIDNLSEHESEPSPAAPARPAEETAPSASVPPPQRSQLGDGRLILSAGTRGNLDEAAAAILSQVLERQGANVRTLPCEALQSARLGELPLGDVALVALSYMNPDSVAHARFLIRRLRRRMPRATLVLCFWNYKMEELAQRDPVAATGADHFTTSLAGAVEIVSASLGQRPEPVSIVPAPAVEPARPAGLTVPKLGPALAT